MSLADDWGAAKSQLDAAVLAVAHVAEKMDATAGMVATLDAAIHGAAPPPAAHPDPAPAPPPPPPVAAIPVPAPAPAPPAEVWVDGYATCWLGSDDVAKEYSGAYGAEFTAETGLTAMMFSLPFSVHVDELLDVIDAGTGNRVNGLRRGDVGPWQTQDAFLRTPGARPLAEKFKGLEVRWDSKRKGWFPDGDGPTTLKCNGAMVDLTPAAWAQLKGTTAQSAFASLPSGNVRIRLYSAATVAAPQPHQQTTSIEDAAIALLGKPFPYAPGTNGGDLGCANVVSAALVAAGRLAAVILSVDALDAKLRSLGWTERTSAPWKPGTALTWAATATSNGHKHIGIAVGNGDAIENSSEHLQVERVSLATYNRPILFGLEPPGA